MPTEMNVHRDALCFMEDMGKTQNHRDRIEQWLAVGCGWLWLVVGGWWRLVAVGAVSGWWRLAADSWWRMAVGGWWSLGAVLKGCP